MVEIGWGTTGWHPHIVRNRVDHLEEGVAFVAGADQGHDARIQNGCASTAEDLFDETAFERIMAAVGKKLKENGLAYNDTSLLAETVIAENEDSLMREAKNHGQIGYVTAVDYTNRTLWVFFYGNADECNCIMAHIRKDVFTKKVQE